MKQLQTKKIPLPLLKISQQDMVWHLCSSLLPFEESASSFLLIQVLLSLSTNPATGSAANQQRWQGNSETGSCSPRESSIPPRWPSHRRRRHAGRSGAAEPQRRGDGRDGGALLWVRQQAVLLLRFRHLWGTHQGRAAALSLYFSLPHLDILRKPGHGKGSEHSLPGCSSSSPLLLPGIWLWSVPHAPADFAQPQGLVLNPSERQPPHPHPSSPWILVVRSPEGSVWAQVKEEIHEKHKIWMCFFFQNEVRCSHGSSGGTTKPLWFPWPSWASLSHPAAVLPLHKVILSRRYHPHIPMLFSPSSLPSSFLTDVLLFFRLVLILRLPISKA